jgi:hypothetical protein
MQWVDRLQEATGWQEPRRECDWPAAESTLGTSLPADYKEICERFGPGYFSSSHFKSGDPSWNLWIMPDRGYNPLVPDWQKTIELIERIPSIAGLFAPYEYYGISGRRGLIEWGHADTPWNFYWLADAAADPDTWPILAKHGDMVPDEEWYRYEMPVSELVYRVVTDPEFAPFHLAYPQKPPTFQRFEGLLSDV